MTTNFSPDFLWGVATSSYQIEGAATADGRGKSIWDTFSATPGKVMNGHTGDVACDHYNRFPEDIAIMKDLGIQSYRFSIAWPRLFPDGATREPRGFDFYNRLVDALLEAGIEPMATLYHWDLPQTLEDVGGWSNRAIVPAFTQYAHETVSVLGDRVEKWITINEPWVMTWLGHMTGIHAPGAKDLKRSIAASHHTALAHAEASRAIKAINPNLKTGLALNMTNFRVEDPNHAEIAELANLMDAHINRWWTEAAIHGRYPAELVRHYGADLEQFIKPGDMEKLKVDADFIGVNYYNDSFINVPQADTPAAIKDSPFPFPQRLNGDSPGPHTDFGWPVTPSGLRDLLVRISRDWPELPAIYITENGASYGTSVDETGTVHDVERMDYLDRHIHFVGEAIEQGAPVAGYYVWSLLDNFEWAEGYGQRFGIVHVDFDTLERVPKESAKLYASIISRYGALAKAV
jgi:beta-glucosidase